MNSVQTDHDTGSSTDQLVQRSKRLRVSILALTLIFSIVLTYLFISVNDIHKVHKHLSEANADLVADSINKNIISLADQTRSVATQLAISGLTDISEGRLQSEISGALKVRIFAPRTAALDRNSSPPFSFASLDMVSRSEVSGDQLIEAIKVDTSWLVTIVSPVQLDSDKSSRGTLFVHMAASRLVQDLDESLLNDGVEVVQSFNQARWNTIFNSKSSNQKQTLTLSRNLKLPIWRVRYHVALPGLIMAETQLTLLVLVVLALIILTLLVMLFFKKNDEGLPGSKRPLATVKTSMPTHPKQKQKVNETTGGRINQLPQSVDHIFRANDIRGIVSTSLSPDLIKKIGQALGSEAIDKGESHMLVACDGRITSPSLTASLTEGLRASGINVVSIGEVPTPLLYFACCHTSISSGVVVTGSHNPAEYNGFKMVISGKPLMGQDIQKLFRRIREEKFSAGKGKLSKLDVIQDYINNVCDSVSVNKKLKVVVDCGNGIAGRIAPDLYDGIGCDVIPLYCEVDGRFPNHPPDPTIPVNLEDLILAVRAEKAALGLALDGDGDRVIIVTAEGQIVWPDQMLMLLVNDILPRNPKSKVVYDVKCSRHLEQLIEQQGGQGLMAKSGHSYLKNKMNESDAILGGEFSGHICIAERWFGFDDGLYAGARLLEIVSKSSEPLEKMLAQFPESISTPEILVRLDEETKFDIVDQFRKMVEGTNATLSDLDGVRLDFPEGWGLVRASNTSPCITLRFEADTQENLSRIRKFFKSKLQDINPSINF